MRKLWIFMGFLFLIILGLAIGCAVSYDFRDWVVGGFLSLTGATGQYVLNWWSGVAANPFYQQWHMLIWFAGGVVGTVIFAKILWPRRPGVMKKVPALGTKSVAIREEPRDIVLSESATPTKTKPEEPAKKEVAEPEPAT